MIPAAPSAGGGRKIPPARRRSAGRLGAALLAALLAWLVGYPLLITALEALGRPQAWTLEHVLEFLRRPDEWLALWRSLWISLASVALAALVGVPLAFLFERTEFPGRRILAALVALPIALPPLVGTLAFLFLYGESGFATRGIQAVLGLERSPWRLTGPGAILLVHTYSMYVYFYLFTRAGLARLDGALGEAAASLGAGSWSILRRVILPLLAPALVGAALLTFMTSLGSFSAPYLFGGGFRVMTTQIVASRLNGELAMVRVETLSLAAVALLGLWLLRKADRQRKLTGTVRGLAPRRRKLGGRAARWAVSAGAYLITAFLLLPHATLALISLVPPGTWVTEALPPVLDLGNYRAVFSEMERLRPLANSLWMAAAATAGALILGLAAARASLRVGGRLGRLLELALLIPWAIPGTVFAIALAATFSVQAPLLGRFLLVGTPLLLPLAYLLRNLPLTGRAALAGLRQVDPSLEEAAASLGAGRWRTLRRVTLPLLRPALVAGAGLAFITALGDFVTSIVLYTYTTRPISIEILSRLRLEELGVSAVYGVVLMVASTAAFLVWGRGDEIQA